MAATLKKLKKFFTFNLTSNFDPNRKLPSPAITENADPSAAPQDRNPSPASSSSFRSRFSRSFSFQSSKSKKTCAICLRTLKSGQGEAIFSAECSHKFHFNCIARNVKHGNRQCPNCRAEWKDIPFQAPSNVLDPKRTNLRPVRVSPHIGPPIIQRQLEPENFSDDEALPSITFSDNPEAISINTFPEYEPISTSDLSQYGVLVRIQAPPLQDDSRAPIDLVTVLDISGSMSSKLSFLQTAVRFIIQNLGPSDRLSLVIFSSTAKRILPLRRMSDSGREDAINAVNCLKCCGGTNIAEGLKKGIRVLAERRECNTVASIILLSDGKDTHSFDCMDPFNTAKSQDSSSTNGDNKDNAVLPIFPVHTFGFGSNHDSMAMHAIADGSGGTFSFIESISILQDAFARCIGGLLSVVAQDVRITFTSVTPGVQIVSIPSGKYKSEIIGQGEQGRIDIGNLYADETKDFLVYLSIQSGETSQSFSLFDLCCSHTNSTSKEMIELKGKKVDILRHDISSTADKTVSLEVIRQKNRLLVAEAIEKAHAMAEIGDLEGAKALLAEKRAALLASTSEGDDGLSSRLESELGEIQDRMCNMEMYEENGRAYVLSGLSSHTWQRATTRGPTSGNASYDTPTMVSMVTKSQVLNVAPPTQSRRFHKSFSSLQRRA